MAEFVGIYAKLPSIDSANLIQTALSSCCVPELVAWVLTSLLLILVLSLTLTGTLRMTCRYSLMLLCIALGCFCVYFCFLKLFYIQDLLITCIFKFFCQAQARCHRIGQSKAVKVYRLITRNSYEREMLDKASLKLGLDRAVLQSMSGNKDSNVNGVRTCDLKQALPFHSIFILFIVKQVSISSSSVTDPAVLQERD